jgi:hypothetical protein
LSSLGFGAGEKAVAAKTLALFELTDHSGKNDSRRRRSRFRISSGRIVWKPGSKSKGIRRFLRDFPIRLGIPFELPGQSVLGGVRLGLFL